MYIIATVGPNIKDRNVLKGIIDSGVNALRFNFAHGSTLEFSEISKTAREMKREIKIILDLSGSKLRVSNNFEYIYKIYDGEEVYFCGEDKYEEVKNDISKIKMKVIPINIENKILTESNLSKLGIKENTMIFNVIYKEKGFIRANAIKGGIIRKGKGCNIKNLGRKTFFLSEKDKEAINWGTNNKVDVICQSFVEDKKDIIEIKEFINKNKLRKSELNIWAKIENLNGFNNIQGIIDESDGIVIGRGDLIPETSIEDTPIYEEIILKEVKNKKNKEAIIATHLFDSMKSGKMPSISEVESIYNFIKSGATGFILAGETSIGKAPIKTVEFLKKLIKKYNG